MNGLKINCKFNKYRFTDFFNSIFEDIDGLYWLFENDSIQPEVEFEQTIQKLPADWYVSKNSIFPHYADDVNEDWNVIIGLKPSHANRSDWHNEFLKKEYLIKHSEIIFANTDAAFWEVFTNNEIWLGAVMADCSKLRNTEVKSSNIVDCAAL